MKKISVTAVVLIMALGSIGAQAASEWQFYLEAERIHQSFSDGDADINTFTFAPTLYWENLSLSLSIPWQQIDGSLFITNAYPNLEYLCGQINGLTSGQKMWLIYRGTLTQQQVQYCGNTGGVETLQQEDSVSGFNDVELFANYYLPPFHDRVSGSVGLGYKHDNGDVEKGLGTGTRELFVETSWLLDADVVGLLLTLGYENIIENETSFDLQDYGYASVDVHMRLLEVARLGVEVHYQQAVADVLDDLTYLVYYLQLGTGEGVGARLFMTDYRDENNYPETEIGGSLSYAF